MGRDATNVVGEHLLPDSAVRATRSCTLESDDTPLMQIDPSPGDLKFDKFEEKLVDKVAIRLHPENSKKPSLLSHLESLGGILQ